jgi:hypothetical protein
MIFSAPKEKCITRLTYREHCSDANSNILSIVLEGYSKAKKELGGFLQNMGQSLEENQFASLVMHI